MEPESPANGAAVARVVLSKLPDGLEKQCRQVMEKYLLNLDNTRLMAIAAAATTAQIQVQGGDARVTLVDPKSNAFHFRMQRQPESGTWPIVAVDYQDLKKLVKREF